MERRAAKECICVEMRLSSEEMKKQVEGPEEAVDELAPPIVMGGRGRGALFMKIGNCSRPKPHRGSAPFYGFLSWTVFVRLTNAICQFYSERCNGARAKPRRKSGVVFNNIGIREVRNFPGM
jgi:hypothetical protein